MKKNKVLGGPISKTRLANQNKAFLKGLTGGVRCSLILKVPFRQLRSLLLRLQAWFGESGGYL